MNTHLAIKGYKHTNWSEVKRIHYRATFMRGNATPEMKTLTRLWALAMLLGLLTTAIGISLAR